MISRLQGWKMSDKSRRVTVKSFSGAKVEDMSHYIKPSLKYKPDNLILHVGTNNLRSNTPNEIAKEIEKICNIVNHDSPSTNIAISQLIVCQDSAELEQKRVCVNETLSSLTKSKGLKLIIHNNIDTNCLNGRKVHLNNRGTINLAKNYKNYLDNLD